MTADADPAGPAQRILAGGFGTLLAAAGALTFYGGVRALTAIHSAGADVYGQRDTLFVVVVTVFAASLALAGVSLVQAAWQARRHDMVPGATLYVSGASLLVIALFVFAAGGTLLACLAAAAGLALMALEYGSDYI